MPSNESKPTDVIVALVAGSTAWQGSNGWVTSGEVRHALKRLAGYACTSRWVAAKLRQMSEVDAPWFERQRGRWGGDWWEYRLTHFGRNGIDNEFKGSVRLVLPWLEVARV